MSRFHRIAILALVLAPLQAGQAATPAASSVRPLLEELQQVGLDPRESYKVVDLQLRRDAIRLRLVHGTLVFLQPAGGRVTGAVFKGTGKVLVLPPDRVERQQLVEFTGSPILTESFTNAYFRFTDGTEAEWHKQIRAGQGQTANPSEVLDFWEPHLAALNRLHSVRILLDFLESPSADNARDKPPVPYFYAAIRGEHLGLFDVMVDDRRSEQILVGQTRWRAGRLYYNVWSSFARRGAQRRSPASVTAYRIDATITAGHELDAVCEVDLELQEPGRRALIFQLSRFLQVEEVASVRGPAATNHSARASEPLEFFQNTTFNEEEARARGSDIVVVVVPGPALQRTLRFRYRGAVISDVGGGVLHVGARGNWYPRIETSSLAHYELRFRWPRSLELVAPGRVRAAREEGEWRESLWVSEVPLPIAGFNLGDYESRRLQHGAVPIVVYANRQLEPRLAQAAQRAESPSSEVQEEERERHSAAPEAEPTSPTLLLEQVGNRVGGALDYFSQLFGPFPYGELKVSQIPARLAQGYPGLLYLSTYSFLPAANQERMGLDERAREHFSQLIPLHETAHQWWGNMVRFPEYREQWLAESLATYSALLYLEQQPQGRATVRQWLERYRNDLLTEGEEGRSLDSVGALTLGARLNSSRSPDAYVRLIYSKGPWVVHMLRHLLRDPETGSDALFLGVLRQLAAREGELTTEEFQRAFEAVLPAYADAEETGRLDWFFEQWVYDTGIPRYRLAWQARPSTSAPGDSEAEGWNVEGTIEQSGVSPLFTMPVPVYARFGEELIRLGRVVVTEDKVAFRFRVTQPPDDVVLDPQGTILWIGDSSWPGEWSGIDESQ